MKVYGSIRQLVEINPIEVIDELIKKEIGSNSWVFEESGKCYVGFEVGGGNHSWDEKKEISKEKYDYIKSLEYVKKYLGNKNNI